ncbi:protein serine threonine kinase [Stylonychia lemnae]|uniref:Protein serine threonine kinase n=1 Tax=Stylonychia lemnae TaxID=5949 RepID=A0A078AR53_STYLE|nr:protein serine threonine kinase [Stylonychia lemnae]|eukprot:CDW84699.1 protein serine threonine kinase [Stylonychia lemnae]
MKNHNYSLFEVYEIKDETFEFQLVKEYELYINKSVLGEGCFHKVNLAIQKRDFVESQQSDGFLLIKEKSIEPKKWVVKKVKSYENLQEVPYDIAKQQIALKLADAFNELLRRRSKSLDIFVRYVKPYLAVPLFNEEHKYVYELEEYQDTKEDNGFYIFNRPTGNIDQNMNQHPHLGIVRLPHTFSHWTYVITNGLVMITDVQGWKVNIGQYVFTDPVVFSNIEGLLGKIDWGQSGMKNWLNKHKCNDMCIKLRLDTMNPDITLIEQLQIYLDKFASKEIQEIMFDLKILTGQRFKESNYNF